MILRNLGALASKPTYPERLFSTCLFALNCGRFQVKLDDLGRARDLWSYRAIIDQRPRVCGPRLFGALYLGKISNHLLALV